MHSFTKVKFDKGRVLQRQSFTKIKLVKKDRVLKRQSFTKAEFYKR